MTLLTLIVLEKVQELPTMVPSLISLGVLDLLWSLPPWPVSLGRSPSRRAGSLDHLLLVAIVPDRGSVKKKNPAEH